MTYEKSPDFRGTAEQFIQERKYLQNVSTKTLNWYSQSFKAFDGCLDSLEALKTRITEMRMRGVKATSVNTYLRCIAAFWKWLGLDWKIPRLKEEQKILETLNETQVRTLLAFKPIGTNMIRAHSLLLTLLDTGLRASEALSLTRESVDLDNFISKVAGKGGKHRLVPISAELRKVLFRRMQKVSERYLFGTKFGTLLTVRNFERDLNKLGERCGITGVRDSPHTMRHRFAVNYLRLGGEHLLPVSPPRALGYENDPDLPAEDFQKVHEGLSVLSAS